MKKAAKFDAPYLLDRLEKPRFDLSWHSVSQASQKHVALMMKSWRQIRFVLHITAASHVVLSYYFEVVNHP